MRGSRTVAALLVAAFLASGSGLQGCAKENPHAPPQGPRVSEPLGQAMFCIKHPEDWLCRRQ